MTVNQKVWYISALVVFVSILIALIVYRITGVIFIAIFFAPPVIHYILKKRMEDEENQSF